MNCAFQMLFSTFANGDCSLSQNGSSILIAIDEWRYEQTCAHLKRDQVNSTFQMRIFAERKISLSDHLKDTLFNLQKLLGITDRQK